LRQGIEPALVELGNLAVWNGGLDGQGIVGIQEVLDLYGILTPPLVSNATPRHAILLGHVLEFNWLAGKHLLLLLERYMEKGRRHLQFFQGP